MMIEIKAPGDYSAYKGKGKPLLFLAGSIEMGMAEDWQAILSAALQSLDVIVLNPRRTNWDPTWEQEIGNAKFREQVEWELTALEEADIALFYFVPETKSPITMMELGLMAKMSPEKMIVCCPDGFWRKGNVDIVCARYGIRESETIETLIPAVKAMLAKKAA